MSPTAQSPAFGISQGRHGDLPFVVSEGTVVARSLLEMATPPLASTSAATPGAWCDAWSLSLRITGRSGLGIAPRI